MKDRIILISGANGTTGAFLARHYLSLEAKLVLLYHTRTDRLTELINHKAVYNIKADLRSMEQTKEAFMLASSYWGVPPDSVIHTASLRSDDHKPFTALAPEDWKKVFDTNMDGFRNILMSFLPAMQEKGFGRVVLMGSNVTQTGLACGSAYAAAKAAMINLMRSVADENRNLNLCLNAISPGPLDTKLEEDYSGEYLNFRRRYFSNYLKQRNGNKLCTVNELAVICDLLLSAKLANFNGQEIVL